MSVTVDVASIRYLSERAIRRMTGRRPEWVRDHTPLMSGCELTPAGYRRVPTVCVVDFIRTHQPSTCPACGNSEPDAD